MAKRFLSPIGLPSGTANPDTGVAGDLFYRTDLNQIVLYTGTAWLPASGSGADSEEVLAILAELGLVGSGSGSPSTTVYITQVDGGVPETTTFALDYSGGNPDSQLATPTDYDLTIGSGGTGSGSFFVSPTPPSSPVEGDTWFNESEAKLLIYYDNFWVESTAGKMGPTGPQGPAITIPGPYANDSAAASAGVEIGESYYRSTGQVFIRLT